MTLALLRISFYTESELVPGDQENKGEGLVYDPQGRP